MLIGRGEIVEVGDLHVDVLHSGADRVDRQAVCCLFIAKEIDGDAVNLIEMFELHGRALYDAARRFIEDGATR
ncbi:hypothetical protein OSH39_19020 [Mycobacterium ulcerans]|nr:hypothetical protein [Mycobacterium ulcerans]MEB3910619.1 hypothetical protein [Mycobacterium ulcerans]MEB3929135.1 hypothetical protein [Mycobacterium ulcerans]MEB3933247.1 hypothetical protein [Mycobacterium ulcerans]MEB3947662.1 hypothetical protein [Mycobacterium ulcerans]